MVIVAIAAFAEKVTVRPENAVIVLPENADGTVQFAAQELQRLILLKTNAKVPISSVPTKGAYTFLMGTPQGTDLAPEEARWETTEKSTRIYGDSTNTGSTINVQLILNTRMKSGDLTAVYDFAEKQLGFLFLAPGKHGTSVETSNTLKLKTGKNSWTPGRLLIREMRPDLHPQQYQHFMGEKQFSWTPLLRVPEAFKMSEEQYNQKIIQTQLWLKQQRMGSSMRLRYGHAFTKWWQNFGAEHPEYFALYDGKREPPLKEHPDFVKMCVSNKGFQEKLLELWQNEQPFPRYVNVCENDGNGYCQCDECRAWDAPDSDGLMTDRYIHFANLMLEKARKINPKTEACFYAYGDYCKPPLREKVNPGVIIGMVTSMMSCQEAQEIFAGWSAAGARKTFLRPNDQHVNTGLPMGFEKTLFEHFQIGYRNGIISTDYDQLHGFWNATGMADYILARAHIDPTQTFEHWEKEYCSAYGAASEIVRKYHEYFRQKIWDKRVWPNREAITKRGKFGNFRRGLMWDLDKYYSIEDFDATDAILAKADKLKLSPNQRRLMDELKLANRHARLTFIATTAPKGKLNAAKELLDFRTKYKDTLNMNWLYLTLIEQRFNDTTQIAKLLDSAK